jgi:XTP/dITP diphosphohydrolase
VLVLMRGADDPQPLVAEGTWWGTIADEARGVGGFGYDPHFRDAETGMSGAEMPLELKNAVSHRGKAMRALIAHLNELREHER